MKRLPPLLLLAAPYAIAAIFVWTPAPSAALILWLAMVVLVFAPNMAYAFWLPKLGWDGRRLLFWGLMLKVCNLPFFLAVFLFCLLTFPFSIPLLIPLFLFDVSLLLPSAAYGASGALCALREGRLSRRAAIVSAALMFVFCLDVFAAAVCYCRVRRAKRTPAAVPR